MTAPTTHWLVKGDRIKTLNNPYEGMIDLPAGTGGTVTRSNPRKGADRQYYVSVRFDNGISAKAWPCVDSHGNVTMELTKAAPAHAAAHAWLARRRPSAKSRRRAAAAAELERRRNARK